MRAWIRLTGTAAVVAYFAAAVALVSYGVTLIWGRTVMRVHHGSAEMAYINSWSGNVQWESNRQGAVTWVSWDLVGKHHIVGAFVIAAGIGLVLAGIGWLIVALGNTFAEDDFDEEPEVTV